MLGPKARTHAGYGLVVALALALAGSGTLAACGDGFEGWDYGVFDVAQTAAPDATCAACDCAAPRLDVSGDATGTCLDCLTSLTGRAMRFKSLIVTEPTVPTASDPDALPKFLNKIWQEDVRRYILNIMLQIQSVDPATRTLTLVGGAAWHDLGMEDLPVVPGDPVTQVPSVYTLLAGVSGPFTVQLDESCGFTLTSDPPTVGFHPGPADPPNICTSDNTPVIPTANSIPIVDLVPTGTINPSCTGVVSGTLRGCIAKEAADRICSWGPAPDYSAWYYTPNEDWPDAPGTPNFCKRWCGTTPPGVPTSAAS